jgi:MOSC domain-containing protein YiiM
VTLINGLFFEGSGFAYIDSRRNIVTLGVELMWLIGREFEVGEAKLRGIKYCDPCKRPSKLSGNDRSFEEVFHDRGGLVAEVLVSGIISVGDSVIPPVKGY